MTVGSGIYIEKGIHLPSTLVGIIVILRIDGCILKTTRESIEVCRHSVFIIWVGKAGGSGNSSGSSGSLGLLLCPLRFDGIVSVWVIASMNGRVIAAMGTSRR